MASLPAPRKKLHVRDEFASPLPVPVGSPAGVPVTSSTWRYYTACYEDGIINVPDPEHAASLWHNGYFGHGRYVHINDDNTFLPKKRWKLIEADGLRGEPWFKEQHRSNSNADMEVSEDMEVQQMSGNDQRNSYQSEVPEIISSDSNDSVIEIVDPEIKKCSRTVLTLNTERERTFNDSDPMAPYGYLQLLPEEALFLSYALGCLIVSKKEMVAKNNYGKRSSSPYTDVSEMTIDRMWNTFLDDDPKFPIKYAVYHHYRTKGWVVKSGLKFGADWVLYPVGPPFYHSQYTIMIQCAWSDTLDIDENLSWRELSWINISATERMNNHVNKTPLICMVLRPRSLNSEKIKKIECLKELTIKEVMLSRWNPNDNELQVNKSR